MTSKFPQQARELEPLEWDVPAASGSATATRSGVALREVSTRATSPSIRDHYIAARFPALARCGADLENVGLVMAGARRYFDERKTDRALELLDLAIEQCPLDEPLQLARLGIAYLLRDAALYTTLAEEFRRLHAASSAWPDVARLGQAVAASATIFGRRQDDSVQGNIEPSPCNWLPACPEVATRSLAARYHRAMARTVSPSEDGTLRAAA
jgi:hypothetical protein